MLHFLERYLAVEELLDLPVVWDRPREAPWSALRDPAEVEHAARGLRAHWVWGTPRSQIWSIRELNRQVDEPPASEIVGET